MLLTIIKEISNKISYWSAYIFGGTFLICIALYFQFVLDELPCVVCIHMRLLITLLIIVAFAGLILRNNRIACWLSNLFIIIIAIAMIERSYLLLGTERGFIFADCSFELGLPAWFTIDQWLPWLYRIETSCGYTPEILLGITMAEALMAISILLLIVSGTVFLVALLPDKK